jgi:SAM-dependent methyltransferase
MPNERSGGGAAVGSGATAPTETSRNLLESARRARLIYRSSLDGTDQLSVRVPGRANDELLSRIAPQVNEKLCQIVPFGGHQPEPERFAQVVLRNLIHDNRTVQRLYLVPSGQAGDPSLRRQMDRDRKLGCEVAVLAVEPFREIPMDDVWLIDESAVVRSDPAQAGGDAWILSTRATDVNETCEFWQQLWDDRQSPVDTVLNQYPPDLTARLLTSAPMIRQAASMLCRGGHVGVEEGPCDWYHGYWQYLRLFNMVSSPSWHPKFYHDQLHRQIYGPAEARRILITGCADYSILAFVLASLNEHDGRRLDVATHVLDLCPTALAACRWYAKQVHAQVTTHEGDITDRSQIVAALGAGPEGKPFDLLIADAFLTRFNRGEADKVMRSWHALLRPGGQVMTTVRLHPRNRDPFATDDRAGDTSFSDPIANFQLRLRRRAEPWRRFLDIDIDNLCEAARQYALRMISNDMGDKEEIVDMFRRNGFKVEYENVEPVDGELVKTSYLRIVARRLG